MVKDALSCGDLSLCSEPFVLLLSFRPVFAPVTVWNQPSGLMADVFGVKVAADAFWVPCSCADSLNLCSGGLPS